MSKTLNYNTISDMCVEKKIKVKELCDYIGITYQGLRTSLNTGKLSSDKVDLLCRCLNITPNYFYGWTEALPPHSEYNSTQYGIMNSQNIGNQGMDILKEQLSIKDNQINKLLDLLNK